jgi:lipopolysaccharide transport system ATP-binding protein
VGDLGFRKKCLGKMDDVGKEGRTVIFVSHDMNSIRRLCRTAVWLDEGEVREIGDVGDVVKKYEASFRGLDGIRSSRVERSEPHRSQKYFAWVCLSGKDDAPTTVFRFGDIMRLTIGMQGRTPHHSHFVEWFLNESSSGNRVAWGATHALTPGDIEGDSKEVSFLIGPLPLAEGPYSISLAMGVPAVIDLDYWQDAIAFEISGCDPTGAGYSYTTRYAPTFIPYEMISR